MQNRPADAAAPAPRRAGSGVAATAGRLARRPESGALVGLLVVYAVFAMLAGPVFLGPAGFASWLNVAAEIGIIALPVGLLMIAGEFDISVGAVIPAASLTVAILAGHYGLPEIVAILGGFGVGLAVGLVNGLLVTRTGIPSLVITIGTMFAVMGLTLGLTVMIVGSTGVFMVPGPTTKALLGQFIDGMFLVTILWWAGFVAVCFFVLQLSPVGNWIYALGGDREGARNAGVPTSGLTIGLFMLSGFAAAFVGVSQVLVYHSAQVLAGQSFIFNSIMCVVIGGVLLTGGFGSVLGIVLGTLTFAIVNQGIFFTGIDPNVGSVIIGALLLVAVLTNDGFRAMALRYAARKP
jgi:simple sugar transport system permease protein